MVFLMNSMIYYLNRLSIVPNRIRGLGEINTILGTFPLSGIPTGEIDEVKELL
jgi:hypothetical protein